MGNGDIYKLETEAKAAGKSTLVIYCESISKDDLQIFPCQMDKVASNIW